MLKLLYAPVRPDNHVSELECSTGMDKGLELRAKRESVQVSVCVNAAP